MQERLVALTLQEQAPAQRLADLLVFSTGTEPRALRCWGVPSLRQYPVIRFAPGEALQLFPDPRPFRVRIALNIKGLPYEYLLRTLLRASTATRPTPTLG